MRVRHGARLPAKSHRRHRGAVGVQRLEVLVAVMLARERRALADAEDGGCTELGAALATLPSGLLEMIADMPTPERLRGARREPAL